MKPDAHQIIDFIDRLKKEPWLRPTQKWWPNYLFRFDHLPSAIQILQSEQLLSRNEASRRGALNFDCANEDVIKITNEQAKEHARLYFRPKTPTQCVMEGFRPLNSIEQHAHCPIPILLLFDSKEMLTKKEVMFSDGNLACSSRVRIGTDNQWLKKLPFRKIYHDTAFKPNERDEIVFRRHAEVIIPTGIDLSALRHIICRSQAEYETLLYKLDFDAYAKWSGRISVKPSLYNLKSTFIETVLMSEKGIVIKFNPNTLCPGPFTLKVRIAGVAKKGEYVWEQKNYYADSFYRITLKRTPICDDYMFEIFLDDELAYANSYSSDETVF